MPKSSDKGERVKNQRDEISEKDLREALKEMKTYVDITEEDLRKIYAIARRHAQERLAPKTRVGEAMTGDVVTTRESADIGEAAILLSEHRISGLPVVDEENHVIGVISEADVLLTAGLRGGHTFRDILRHLLGEPLPARKVGNTVGAVMASPAITITADAEITEAARVLDERRIKRLPVVDAENRLIGIISRADIVRVISKK